MPTVKFFPQVCMMYSTLWIRNNELFVSVTYQPESKSVGIKILIPGS